MMYFYRHPMMDRINRRSEPLEITMWDSSWMRRRYRGGGFEDWGRAAGYTFNCTSNMAEPQFLGLWEDVGWHRRMTNIIRSAAPERKP